jgi:ribonuclease E
VGENDNDEPLSPSSNAYVDDDGKPKKRRRRRRRKSKQGVEDQEVAVNAIEKKEESDVTLAGDPKETSEIKNSISSDQEAENKKLPGDDDANTAVPKRKRSPRKKTVVSRDNEQSSEVSDTKAPPTAPELRENDEGSDALKVKSKPRARKKVTKETDTKDAGHSLKSGSISEGEEPVKKSDKKVTKVSKSKPVGTKKASTQSVTAESMDEDINKSIIENKVNTLEGEETKKTRRRGWWSKKS